MVLIRAFLRKSRIKNIVVLQQVSKKVVKKLIKLIITVLLVLLLLGDFVYISYQIFARKCLICRLKRKEEASYLRQRALFDAH